MSVRHALLGLLAQRPRHGYELHAAFEAIIGGAKNWDLKPAQVYTTLTRLEEAGLVSVSATEQDGGPEKRIYELTDQGNAELQTWLNEASPMQPQRDEFFLKMMIGLASGACDPHHMLQTQRAALYRALHEVTIHRSQVDPAQALAQVLLYDQAVMHLEADLRWMEMVEARLEEIRRQPLPEPELRRRGRPKENK
ncbi:MAG TPA: PadR family transcriptional regulator [Anaerolineaceae bacterium]|nr:PadR family transcriptional regulator [Anaerolineaceae bacterium]